MFQDSGIRLVVLGVGTFQRDTNLARNSLTGFERAAGGTAASMNMIGASISRLGQLWTTAISVPLLVTTGVLINSGIQFEDAFAGVSKTVEGVADNFGNLTAQGEVLRKQFRELALEIPVSVNELARLGEQAGALGIQQDQLTGFVKIVAELGATTNLSAEDAGNAIAKMGNIMGVSANQMSDFASRAGSAIVDLGNKSAATESDIINMAYRISGAGKAIGLTTQEILGLSTSVSEMGVNAEAGGTAVSRILLEMQSALAEGGDKLALFAKAAGVTSEEFRNLVKNSPIQAFERITSGLARMQEEGVLTSDMLAALGMNSVRLRDVINRFGPDMGNLTKNINISNAAWKENTALSIEAQKRFNTTKSQIILLKNAFVDLGITIFDLYSGQIKALVNGIKDVVTALNTMNEGSLRSVLRIGAIIAAIGPLLVILGTLIQLWANLRSYATIATVALGGISWPILAIIAAVAALGIAWNKNFLGIRDTIPKVIKEVKNVAYWIGKAFNFGKNIPGGNMLTAVSAAFRSLTYIYKDNKTTFFSNVLQAFGMGEESAQKLGMAIRNFITPAFEGFAYALLVINNLFNTVSNWVGIIITDFLRFTGVVDILKNAFLAFLSGDFDFAFVSLKLAWEHIVLWYNTEGKALILQALSDIINIILATVEENGPSLINKLVGWGKAFISWVIDVAPDVVDALGDLLGDILTWIGEKVAELDSSLLDWANSFLDWVTPLLSDAIPKLGSYLTVILDWILEETTALVEKLLLWAAAFIDWLGPVLVDILPKLGEFLGTITSWLIFDALPKLVVELLKLAAEFVAWVPQAIIDIAPELAKFLKSVTEFILYRLIPGVYNAIYQMGKSFINGMIKGIENNWDSFKNWIFDKIKSISPQLGEEIAKALGLSSSAPSGGGGGGSRGFGYDPNMPQGATGGPIRGPMVVGERGRELYVPGQSGYILNNQLTKLLSAVMGNVYATRPGTNASNMYNRSFAPTIYGAPISNQDQLTGDLERMYRMATMGAG